MASSQSSSDPEKLEREIEEATRHVSRVMSRMLEIIDTELKKSGVDLEEYDTWLKQAEKEQAKRKASLESEQEQSKRRLLRKWKRY